MQKIKRTAKSQNGVCDDDDDDDECAGKRESEYTYTYTHNSDLRGWCCAMAERCAMLFDTVKKNWLNWSQLNSFWGFCVVYNIIPLHHLRIVGIYNTPTRDTSHKAHWYFAILYRYKYIKCSFENEDRCRCKYTAIITDWVKQI